LLLWRLSTDRGCGGGGGSRGGGCGGREVNAVAESHHCFVVHGLTDHLFKVSLGHSCDLFVNLLGIVNAEILRDGHDWTLWIGTTPLVPVGTRRAELRRTQDVDAAVVAQQQILASQIVEAWHLAQSLKVLFIATMSIAALSALGIAIIMRVTSVNAGHANPMGHPAPLVMPETLGWAAQHFGAVFILPAEL